MSDIRIISHKRSNNFTIVPNHIINETSLKLEERMLLIWIFSKPEQWQLNYKSICTIHNISANKLASISKNLQANNYLFIQKESSGKTTWFAFENQEDCLELKKMHTPKCTPLDPIPKPYSQNESEGSKGENDGLLTENTPKCTHNGMHTSKKEENTPLDPVLTPESQKPSLAFESALVSTDPLVRTERDKVISSLENEQVEKYFDELWKAWPNAKNKKRSKTAFKTFIRGMSLNGVHELVCKLIDDIQTRERAKQLGFTEMMLSTYINNERFEDGISGEQASVDDARALSDAKARALFG